MRSLLNTAAAPAMAQARSRPAGHDLGWLTTAFLVSIALPSDISPVLGSAALPPYRIVGLIALFVLLPRMLRAGTFRWNFADVCVAFLALWQPICHIVNESSATSWQAAGSGFLECMSYFIARLAVTNLSGLTNVARVITIIMFVILPFTFVEAVFRVHIVHEFMGAHLPATVFDIRLGLLRAMGPFEHTIMYGTFCASVLSLSWYILPRRMRMIRTIFVAFATFLSVSTGPMMAGGLQIGLSLWDRILERVPSRWTILVSGVVTGLLVLSVASNRPLINIVISYLTLVPATGWIRLAQWTYGWPDVMRNWLFGYGYNDWPRPHWLQSSVDSYWLHRALMFGLPGLIGHILATGSAILIVARAKLSGAQRTLDDARKGWMFAVVAISIVGITVDYWHAMNAYFFFMMGLGLWLADPAVAAQPVPTPQRPALSRGLPLIRPRARSR